MMDKTLWIKGCAGLGNRLHTLSSGIEYAKRTRRKIIIDWTDGQFAPEGENAFYNVFDLVDIDYEQKLPDENEIKSTSVYPPIWKKSPSSNIYDLFEEAEIKQTILQRIPVRWIPRGPLRKVHGYWRSKTEWENYQQKKWHVVPFMFRSGNVLMGDDYSYDLEEDVVISCDFCPPLRASELKKHIQVSHDVKNKVSEFYEKNAMQGNSVAVHIRNTDKKPTSDINSLVSALAGDQYKSRKILLCTDNPETDRLFKEKLDNVVSFQKTTQFDKDLPPHRVSYEYGGVDKRVMLEESLIDMCLLAESDEFLYQGNSSFSQIALILRDEKNTNMRDWSTIV